LRRVEGVRRVSLEEQLVPDGILKGGALTSFVPVERD
jgi:hypothetical protein